MKSSSPLSFSLSSGGPPRSALRRRTSVYRVAPDGRPGGDRLGAHDRHRGVDRRRSRERRHAGTDARDAGPARARRRRPRGQGGHGAAARPSSTAPRRWSDPKSRALRTWTRRRPSTQVAVARWEKAKTLRDYAVIRAPFAGVVTEKYARIGQKVIEDGSEPLFKITASEPLLARVYLPEEELCGSAWGTGSRSCRTGSRTRARPETSSSSAPRSIRRAARSRSSCGCAASPAGRLLRPGVAVKVRFLRPGQVARSRAGACPTHRPGSSRPPAFDPRPRPGARHQEHVVPAAAAALEPRGALGGSRSSAGPCSELLASTVERLDGIAGRFRRRRTRSSSRCRWTSNGLLRRGRVAARRARGRRRPAGRRFPWRSGDAPPIWGDPYYLRDALGSLVENAVEAAAPGGKVLVRSFAGGTARAPAGGRRDHRQRLRA